MDEKQATEVLETLTDLLEVVKLAHHYLFTSTGPDDIDIGELATDMERAIARAEGYSVAK